MDDEIATDEDILSSIRVSEQVTGYTFAEWKKFAQDDSFPNLVTRQAWYAHSGFEHLLPEQSTPSEQKLRIYVNRGLDWTPNKRAAHAVHAALQALGVHPGCKVVVLDAGPTKIDAMRVSIHDAGHTELEPGTLTAGTNWPADSEE